jgi:hypothetical protein
MTPGEKASKLKKFFQDPKLVHKNPHLYNRYDILQELIPRDRIDDYKLRDAYEDILKTNEFANEYNYMLDVFNAIKDAYFPAG